MRFPFLYPSGVSFLGVLTIRCRINATVVGSKNTKDDADEHVEDEKKEEEKAEDAGDASEEPKTE